VLQAVGLLGLLAVGLRVQEQVARLGLGLRLVVVMRSVRSLRRLALPFSFPLPAVAGCF